MTFNPPYSGRRSSIDPTAGRPESPPSVVRHRALVLLAMNWPGMLLVIGAILAGTIRPALVSDLPTSLGGWYTLAFVLISLLVIPLGMKAGEVHGPKRALLATSLCGVAGQALTAVAPTFTVALLGHALTALYTPAGPLCLLAMRDYFPRRRFAAVVVCILIVIGALVAATNAVSAQLVEHLGWRGTSWCLVALTLLAVVLLAAVPGRPKRQFALKDLDVAERLLQGSVLALVVLGVLKGSDWGWTSPGVLGAIGTGIVLGMFAAARARATRRDAT